MRESRRLRCLGSKKHGLLEFESQNNVVGEARSSFSFTIDDFLDSESRVPSLSSVICGVRSADVMSEA